MFSRIPLPLRQAIAITIGALVLGTLLVFTLAPLFFTDNHPPIEPLTPSITDTGN